MKKPIVIAVIALAGVITTLSLVLPRILTPAPASASSSAEIELTGIIRDFRRDHPDFRILTATGHVAGNAAAALDAGGRPSLSGNGYTVATQWTNGTDPIAPHLFKEPVLDPVKVVLSSPPTIPDNSTFDSWDPAAGPYGGTNVGPAPEWELNATMPEIVVPSDLTSMSSRGNANWSNKTLDGDYRFGRLNLGGNTAVTGHARVLCDADFRLKSNGTLTVAAGASLELYLMEGGEVAPGAAFNADSNDPDRVKVFNLGTAELKFQLPGAEVYARVVSPDALLRLMPGAQLFGSFVGKSIDLQPGSGLHVDGFYMPRDACDRPFTDVKGTAGDLSAGAVDSASSFGEWYRDVMGTNLSEMHVISLVRDAAGIYEYATPAFYPIDDRLHGNEGESHNNYFTYAIGARFTYEACGGQFVEFEGSDDVWIFIDGDLGMDLGGTQPNMRQVLEADRLGLDDGASVHLKFYYAHRSWAPPAFRLRTNIELDTSGSHPPINAAYD